MRLQPLRPDGPATRAVWGQRRLAVGLGVLVAVFTWFAAVSRASAEAPAADPAREDPPPVPIDPNDTPFMRPPNNQPASTPLRTRPDLRRGYSSVRRFAITVAPMFASMRLPFVGRCVAPCSNNNPPPRTHGVGIGGELDFQLIRWIWLRVQTSYAIHPVGDVRGEDDEMKTVVFAPAGTIRSFAFGLGPVVALDLGRFLPLIEGGLGGHRIATPDGVITGQAGMACGDDGTCDVGLRCGPENTCQQSILPELYFGGAVDILVRRHLSFGAQFRYHALLSAPGKFPVYILGGLRVTARF